MAEGYWNPIAKQGTWTLNMGRNTYTTIDTHYVIIGDSLVFARANFTLTGQTDSGNSYVDLHDSNLPEPKSYASIIGTWQVDTLNKSGIMTSSPYANKWTAWFMVTDSRTALTDYVGNTMSLVMIYEI